MTVQSSKSKVQGFDTTGRIFVHGLGAVSPAGWSAGELCGALEKNLPLPVQTLARPGWEKTLCIRPVPAPLTRPDFLAHPRLRRASAMAQHSVAAALEAIGSDAAEIQSHKLRLGVIVCMLAGAVNYSRRFYEEVLRDPATASPLIFPETVFNAPASHLAACLNSPGINYTLVGDDGTFLQGLALAADWLETERVDACVVVGVEELDWIVADALRLFQRAAIYSGGAGAVYLKKIPAAVELAAVTDSFLFSQEQSRAQATEKMLAQLPAAAADEIFDGGTSKKILGEAFVASAAWQCVAACDALRREKSSAANVSVVGANQQAIGARFVRAS